MMIEPSRKSRSVFTWVASGIALGAGIGVALGNIALGVGVGLALGLGLWSATDSRRASRPDD